MRSTILEKRRTWNTLIAAGAKAVLDGRLPVNKVVEGLAAQAAGDVRKKISQITTPPLRPLTLLLRKYKLNMIPGCKYTKITPQTFAILLSMQERGKIDTAGVTDKPLIDVGPEGGTMITSLTYTVDK